MFCSLCSFSSQYVLVAIDLGAFHMHVVAQCRMVTGSRQITEVKQRRARLVLGWVTAARSSHAVGHV